MVIFKTFIALLLDIICLVSVESFCFARFIAAYDWNILNDAKMIVCTLLIFCLVFYIINHKLFIEPIPISYMAFISLVDMLAVAAMLYLVIFPNPILRVPTVKDCWSVVTVQITILFFRTCAFLKNKSKKRGT